MSTHNISFHGEIRKISRYTAYLELRFNTNFIADANAIIAQDTCNREYPLIFLISP